MHCANCNLPKEDYARIKVEIVDKKSKEVIEFLYGEIICIDCLKKRYKDRTKIRVYV
jgi:ribosomal protein L34E